MGKIILLVLWHQGLGMNTAWGEMMSSIRRELDEQTPLQARLDRLASTIGNLGLAVALIVQL